MSGASAPRCGPQPSPGATPRRAHIGREVLGRVRVHHGHRQPERLAGFTLRALAGISVPGGTVPLIQRAPELARIDEVLAQARAGTGAALVIEGSAGIGKTSLLTRAREAAASAGMRVLYARGAELEREYGMGVVRQWLEPAVRELDSAELFKGAAGLARSVLFEDAHESSGSQAGILHGLYWLLATIAESAPVLLALDDAHWADESSLMFVAYVAGRIESLPLALVLCTRMESHGAAAAIVDRIRHEPTTFAMQPGPLDTAGIEDFLLGRGGLAVDHDFAVACHQATGGNPFLLGELVSAVDAQGLTYSSAVASRVSEITSPTVARSVKLTLTQLGTTATATARALAILGEGVDVDLVAELAGISTAAAEEAAGALLEAGIFDDALPLRFRHPLIAAAVRSSQGTLVQAEQHRRAADLLRRRDAAVERVALQLVHTAPVGEQRVVADLREAAARARARGAPASAARLLERALLEPPAPGERARLLLQLADAQYAVGLTEQAAQHYDEARRSSEDPELRGRALIGLFQARGGSFDEQRALAPLFEQMKPEILAYDRELGLRIWALQLLATHPGEGWKVAAQGSESLKCSTPGEAILLGHLALPITNPGVTAAETAALTERAAEHADALLEEGATALVLTGMVLGLLWSDRLETAKSLLDRAIAVGQRRGAIADVALAHGFRANVHRRAGRLLDAEADARTALASSAGAGWAGAGLGALVPLVGSLIDQGRLEDAERELAVLEGHIPDAPALTPLLFERMRLNAARRNYGEALADWRDARRRAERHFDKIDVSFLTGLLAAAEYYRALEDDEQADGLLAEALNLAEHWGAPGHIGQARHAAARLTDGEDSVARLQDAVEHLRRSPARLDLARALISLGGALRRRGQRSESREPLREGHELARACGAAELADTARAELRASGMRLRREALTGAASLTASERRIAELAAAGASNREIAQQLFLTVKTVESHLSSAYRKLDIGGRSELERALA